MRRLRVALGDDYEKDAALIATGQAPEAARGWPRPLE